MKLFTFSELSADAQKKAMKQYQNESVLEENSDDETYDILFYDLTNDRYSESGELISTEEAT